jgi:hypothetical protein
MLSALFGSMPATLSRQRGAAIRAVRVGALDEETRR